MRPCCMRSRRARSVAETVLGDHRPDVWISDRYGGQQELGGRHQVCLAHVLRDVQYAIDCGDTIFAPKVRDHLRWAIGVGRRRHRFRDTTLASYAAKANLKLFRLMHAPVAHPAGKVLMKQIKAWRTKFFVFLTNRDVPATNMPPNARSAPRSCSARSLAASASSGVPASMLAIAPSPAPPACAASPPLAIGDLVDGSFVVA